MFADRILYYASSITASTAPRQTRLHLTGRKYYPYINYSATEREMLQCTEIFDDPANDTIEAAAPQILGCVDADISSGVPQCLLTEYC